MGLNGSECERVCVCVVLRMCACVRVRASVGKMSLSAEAKKVKNISNCLFFPSEVDVCRFDLQPCTEAEERQIFLGKKNRTVFTPP